MTTAGAGRRSASGGRRRTTQADVAERAKVSSAIVSAVVNRTQHGNIRISESTRQRVWDAVRELGYVPNIAARNLARGSNKLIGVFTYQPVFPMESRDFYYEFLVGIEEEAEDAGYNLLMFTGSKTADGTRSIYSDGVNSLQLADGSVLVGTNEAPAEISRLAEESYPFVIVGRRDIPGVEASYVAGDYASGTADVVRELVKRGHRRIAMFCGSSDHESMIDRRAGFLRARAELDLNAADCPLWTYGPGPRVASQAEGLISSPEASVEWIRERGVTALIAEVTDVAAKIKAVARETGMTVPGDLALIGLSDSPIETTEESLSQLQIPRKEMGRESVRLLLKLLADPSGGPLRTSLPCGFHEGTTIGGQVSS